MRNTIDEAMCFIHDRDAKRGAYWSDTTDALADAMVEYAALKIKELAATDSQQTQAKIVRGCKECSLYNECTDGENGSRKMVQECWSGDYLLFVPRTTSAVR